jgi:hypothetical protein
MFCYLRDEFNLNEKPLAINARCHLCKSEGHLFDRCPRLSYTLDKGDYIRKKIADEVQTTRVPLPRTTKRKKAKSVNIKRTVELSTQDFLNSNEASIEDYLGF